jgi:hypothetical protein
VSAWAGWEVQFLKAAGLPETVSNEAFLNQWNVEDNTNCRNNPVDISRNVSGSTACAALPNGKQARNYTSHAQAASAFSAQLKSGSYPDLLAALRSGEPYKVSDPAKVAQDLGRWGSGVFQQVYAGAVTTPPNPPQQTLVAPRAHGGWNDLRRSVNHKMPRALANAGNLTRQALRATSQGRKVKL